MAENTFTLPSFAKINWFLRVLGKRPDGFHELCTVFQTVSLHDNLTFSKHNEIVLICEEKKIPTDEKNLIIKAALELKQKFNIKSGAKIHLEKRIPAPGGLGGGSSNAATTFFGLIKLWRIEIDFAELLETGKKIGSDVPFFFFGGTALGTGRGTKILPLDDFTENHLLIVTPNVNVSTAEAFARLSVPHLTNKSPKSILQICRNEAQTLNLQHSLLINDFESSVFKIEPEIERVKEKLLELRAKHTLLSGSGASVFAIFESRSRLQFAFDELKTKQTWRKFVVRTISRREYRGLLNL
ncbi:MAG: 4-(cytidine 5'-diphospho)-2-C-methyl-D-erythritol kinase [Acidobacteria bacterium]|jgi:4-diphosphocytidyl-2-C-methyl-D-erythritol kinase|nr:4-(cytidine 5'-diphospho)-2-C-methyl-D-erythritol kinase [Acidobacteriota bacterium]